MQSIKLLIIEDDVDQRELLQEVLEGHFGQESVAAVADGTSALAQALESFDLILADYHLPDMSGMELLVQIRKRCATPVIMVTGENIANIAAEAIRQGATDYVVKVGDYLFTIPLVVQKNLTIVQIKRENEQLRLNLEKALREVSDKNAQLEKSLLRVEEMAATDPLTGLYNRRHFGRVLEQLYAEAQRYGKELAAVMIDLDGYKPINDVYGHAVGDQLLVVAAKVITANMRRMDIAARYGGDEFVLLLPHAAEGDASNVVNRVREEFAAASAVVLQRATGVTMSIGIATLSCTRAPGPEQLVAFADRALYQAKEGGRNRTSVSASPIIPAESAAPAALPILH